MDTLTLYLIIAGLIGSALKAVVTASQSTFSRQSIVDIVIGGAAAGLYPVFGSFPDGMALIHKALLVGLISYFSSDLITNLAKQGVRFLEKKVVVLLLVVPTLALTGCAFGMAQMTPEQLEALAKNREASIACFDGTYAGAKIRMIFVNADKGVPAGATVKADCEMQFMSGQK